MSPCAGDLVYWEYPFNLGWVRSRLPVQCKCSTCIGRNPICSFTRGHRPGRLARGSGSRRYCNAQRLPLIPQISDFAMASQSKQASLVLVPASDSFATIMALNSVCSVLRRWEWSSRSCNYTTRLRQRHALAAMWPFGKYNHPK